MSAEEIQEFRNGLAQFGCNGVTFDTLKANFENAVNNLPADLQSIAITSEVLKRRILRGFRSFINENTRSFAISGYLGAGDFNSWLEELAAQVLPEHQGNNANRLWGIHFSPLVNIYDSMIECMGEYYEQLHAEINNGNNNGNSIANNEDPAVPAPNVPAAAPGADPNSPAPAAGGRRSRRSKRKSSRSNRKSRRNSRRRR